VRELYRSYSKKENQNEKKKKGRKKKKKKKEKKKNRTQRRRDAETQRRREEGRFSSLRLCVLASLRFLPRSPGSLPDRRWHITSPP
jgi:hypothetical protein